jgi:hypothetical protein
MSKSFNSYHSPPLLLLLLLIELLTANCHEHAPTQSPSIFVQQEGKEDKMKAPVTMNIGNVDF